LDLILPDDTVLKFTEVMLSEDGNEMGAPAVQYLVLSIKLEVVASMTGACMWLVQPGVVARPVKEGLEPPIFWSSLGGKRKYPSHREPKDGTKDPRLFHCSLQQGQMPYVSH
jgi:hypothetical protein